MTELTQDILGEGKEDGIISCLLGLEPTENRHKGIDLGSQEVRIGTCIWVSPGDILEVGLGHGKEIIDVIDSKLGKSKAVRMISFIRFKDIEHNMLQRVGASSRGHDGFGKK